MSGPPLQVSEITAPGERLVDGSIEGWVESTVELSPNKARLQARLRSIDNEDALICFLHRFVLFNDALAARVPFLAGLIHLTPDVFLDPDGDEGFCRQCNGRIAAYVAEAAADEYQMTAEQNLVHQYLSQQFFLGALDYFDRDRRTFNSRFPIPELLTTLLNEARRKHFVGNDPEQLFAALGFHVGLEVFAHQEFNLVDAWLKERYPGLVAQLRRGDRSGNAYRWLAIHTVVEITHYRAGLEALKLALDTYRAPLDRPRMSESIRNGLASFIDLQGRFYEAILCDFE